MLTKHEETLTWCPSMHMHTHTQRAHPQAPGRPGPSRAHVAAAGEAVQHQPGDDAVHPGPHLLPGVHGHLPVAEQGAAADQLPVPTGAQLQWARGQLARSCGMQASLPTSPWEHTHGEQPACAQAQGQAPRPRPAPPPGSPPAPLLLQAEPVPREAPKPHTYHLRSGQALWPVSPNEGVDPMCGAIGTRLRSARPQQEQGRPKPPTPAPQGDGSGKVHRQGSSKQTAARA